jgi:hypothetical protein
MKTFRIVVICAVALAAGHVWAQDKTVPPVSEQPAQDVGGVTDVSTSESGSPKGMTQQQVYQDLVRSQQSGERARLWKDPYNGH